MKNDLIKRIGKLISNKSIGENDILIKLKNIINESEDKFNAKANATSISNLISKNLTLLNNKKQDENVIKTRFNEFDNLFGGLSLGELVVVGGRPSMGKTQLLVNLALNVSIKIPVLYFTFDLSESVLTSRFISAISNIEISKLLHPDLTEAEKKIVNTIGAKLNSHKIYINESYNLTMQDLRTFCENQIKEKDVKVIIVDYLQLMTSKESNIRHLKVGSFTHELRKIAEGFNVCVILASQLSRSVEIRGGDKRPQLSDLKDSGAIEQDADKVIFLYRPEYYRITIDEEGLPTKGALELIMAKNRNGTLGTVKLRRNLNFTSFSNLCDDLKDFNFQIYRPNEN